MSAGLTEISNPGGDAGPLYPNQIPQSKHRYALLFQCVDTFCAAVSALTDQSDLRKRLETGFVRVLLALIKKECDLT